MEDLIRQAEERKDESVSSAPNISVEEATKAEIQRMNDRAIALITESITEATDQVQAIAQKAEEEKEALAERLNSAERAREALMQNLFVMTERDHRGGMPRYREDIY